MPTFTDAQLTAQLSQAGRAFKKSDNYHAVRNRYTVESAQYLLQLTGIFTENNEVVATGKDEPLTILELGCGTGLLTEAMMGALGRKSHFSYIATDPLESMRQTFLKNFPSVEFKACKAENIPMPDSSVDAIVAAASFHWFATQQAYQEIYRVLKPGGKIGYITNLPSEHEGPEWARKINELLWDCYRKSGAPWERDMRWREELLASKLFKDYKEDFSLRYFQAITLEQCVECFASYGGVVASETRQQETFRQKLRNVLDNSFTKKGVEFTGVPYVTEIYHCQSVKGCCGEAREDVQGETEEFPGQ